MFIVTATLFGVSVSWDTVLTISPLSRLPSFEVTTYKPYPILNSAFMSFLLALSDDCAMYSRHSSSVMASICSRFSSFSADFIFTTGSTKVRFFDSSSIPFIILAARGAHVPFSTNAIVRFLNALSVRWSIYSFMNGNMPEL